MFLLLLSLSGAVSAEAIGPSYPIREPDLLHEIEMHLRKKEKSGELAKLQKEAIDRSRNSMTNPKPVPGVTRTETARTFYWDPSYRVPETVKGPDGQIIATAGQVFNPLSVISLSKHLLFIDARDPAQVKRAAALVDYYDGRVKVILTGGSWLDLSRAWKRQIYFDQNGTLVRRFGIQHVPALVSQEGMKIRIDELKA